MHTLHWTKTPIWGWENGSVLTDITCCTIMRTKSNPKHPCKARLASMCWQSQISLDRDKKMPGACWTAELANQTPESARDPSPTNEMKSVWGKHLMWPLTSIYTCTCIHIQMCTHTCKRIHMYSIYTWENFTNKFGLASVFERVWGYCLKESIGLKTPWSTLI